MKHAIHAAILCAAASVVACGAGNQDPAEMKSEVEVTGCLTGTGDEFVLTELDRAETGTTIAAPSTESYRLIGDASVFRQHVGRQVRVSGMADTPEVAIVREAAPAVAASPGVGTSGSESTGTSAGQAPAAGAGPTPKVATEQQTRLEISSLRVRSVAPTGSSCTR